MLTREEELEYIRDKIIRLSRIISALIDMIYLDARVGRYAEQVHVDETLLSQTVNLRRDIANLTDKFLRVYFSEEKEGVRTIHPMPDYWSDQRTYELIFKEKISATEP